MDDQSGRATGISEQTREPWQRIVIHRQVDAQFAEHAIGLNEVTLHIDQEQRRVRRVDELAQLGEDLFPLNGYQRDSSSDSTTLTAATKPPRSFRSTIRA